MRIFVTVGAQLPFDRLVSAVDAWAAMNPGHNVRAQIGATALEPRHVQWSRFLTPSEFERAYDEADAIVGHAGTGTIFAALERRKALVVMPRRADLRETRNNHQIATAKRFADLAGVAVAWNELELAARLATVDLALPSRTLPKQSGGALVRAIAEFIDAD